MPYGLPHGGLPRQAPLRQVNQRSAAKINRNGQPVWPCQFRQRRNVNTAREAAHGVITAMNLHQHRAARCDGVGVIRRMGTVGGADFHQFCTCALHDVGDAECAADFDQFATRDDDFFLLRQCIQHQQYGGSVVVDNGGCFGAGEFAQYAFNQVVTVAAATGFQVEFKIAGRCQRTDYRLHRFIRQKCAT